MALTDLHVSDEALEALHQARPTGRPGFMVYDGLGQEVDPLLAQLSSEPARNFLFGNTILHLGFPEGEKGAAITVHKLSGALTTWEVLKQRVMVVGAPSFEEERISMRPSTKQGKQGLTEIKIPKAEMPALIMLPGKNFTPMTPIAEPLSEVLGATIRREPEYPRPQLVR